MNNPYFNAVYSQKGVPAVFDGSTIAESFKYNYARLDYLCNDLTPVQWYEKKGLVKNNPNTLGLRRVIEFTDGSKATIVCFPGGNLSHIKTAKV